MRMASQDRFNGNAVKGSEMLRDAIFRAQGLDVFVKRTCCPTCGSAIGESGAVKRIQRVVAAYYDLPPEAMVSQRTGRAVSHPRQVAMFLCREMTPRSLPDIGRRFGGRDHTTVMHAIRAVKSRLSNPQVLHEINDLKERLSANSDIEQTVILQEEMAAQ